VPPWIFKHGTNIVDRGLKLLFFGLFYYFSVFFSVGFPLENFLPTPLAVMFILGVVDFDDQLVFRYILRKRFIVNNFHGLDLTSGYSTRSSLSEKISKAGLLISPL